MATLKSSSLPPTVEARDYVLAKVRSAVEPTDARTLSKQLDPPFQYSAIVLTRLLDEFVADGVLYRYPGKTAKGAARYWDRDFVAVASAAIIRALDQAALPLTAKELSTFLKEPIAFAERDLIPILEAAASRGEIHRFPAKTAKGKERFWRQSVLEYGRRIARQILQAKGPLTSAKLQASLKELGKAEFDQVCQSLRGAGAIFVHPPVKSGPPLFGIRPPAPEVYLKQVQLELSKVVKKLQDVDVPLDSLRRAVVQVVEAAGIPFSVSTAELKPTGRPSVDLVRLMHQLESGAGRGALVGARDLRRIAGLSKKAFDEAVFESAKSGRISLHQHDFPASLTESEREELITDGSGNYFVGVALRQSGV